MDEVDHGTRRIRPPWCGRVEERRKDGEGRCEKNTTGDLGRQEVPSLEQVVKEVSARTLNDWCILRM